MHPLFIQVTNLFMPFTIQEESFHWNLNFVISLMSNSLNFYSANRKIFQNFLMMAYITKIKKSKFTNIQFPEFDHSGQGL